MGPRRGPLGMPFGYRVECGFSGGDLKYWLSGIKNGRDTRVWKNPLSGNKTPFAPDFFGCCGGNNNGENKAPFSWRKNQRLLISSEFNEERIAEPTFTICSSEFSKIEGKGASFKLVSTHMCLSALPRSWISNKASEHRWSQAIN